MSNSNNITEDKITFDNMELKEDLLRGIYGYGFESPSIIQQKAIVPLIKERDVIAQAQSGTGKTGAFCIGCLERIDINIKKVQIIILSPTKELARQTYNVFNSLGEFLKIESILMVGGINIEESKKKLRTGVQAIIGTPGRILHMLKDKYFNTDNIKLLVIDEADELLSIGF